MIKKEIFVQELGKKLYCNIVRKVIKVMKYIVKKIGVLIITLFLVSFITFFAFSVIPGDSVIASLGTEATPEAIEALREELGLNDPLPMRYLHWLKDSIRGDFNISTQFNEPVARLLLEKLPVTLTLAILSFLMVVLVGIPLGIYTARKEGSKIDRSILFINQIFMSIPPFFLGIILTLIFGIILKWFTPGGYVDYREDTRGFLEYLILPAIAIAIPKIAMVVKFLRSSILRETRLDYVRTAFSKGSKENYVTYVHILKNAMLPVVTFLALVLVDVLAGSIIVEQVFNIPGLGRLLVTAISNRDLYVVQAIVLYIITTVVVINFVVDIIYQRLDPRVRV